MSHAFYVSGAFLFSAIALAALVGWTLFDYRRRLRQIAKLERRGIRRRSAETGQ